MAEFEYDGVQLLWRSTTRCQGYGRVPLQNTFLLTFCSFLKLTRRQITQKTFASTFLELPKNSNARFHLLNFFFVVFSVFLLNLFCCLRSSLGRQISNFNVKVQKCILLLWPSLKSTVCQSHLWNICVQMPLYFYVGFVERVKKITGQQ